MLQERLNFTKNMPHCQFDNGRHLAIIPGVDTFSKVSGQHAEMEDVHG